MDAFVNKPAGGDGWGNVGLLGKGALGLGVGCVCVLCVCVGGEGDLLSLLPVVHK